LLCTASALIPRHASLMAARLHVPGMGGTESCKFGLAVFLAARVFKASSDKKLIFD
jgi:hypothetical protein